MSAEGRGLDPWLQGRRLGVVLALTVLAFTAAGVIQTWPILGRPYDYGWPPLDDYQRYHYFAVDVLRHGPAMRAAPAPYVIPAGFLYVYFVALCYAIVGVQPPVVFVLQSAMLGVSVVLLFLAFRRGLSGTAQAVLLGGLGTFAFLDVGRQYALQLFSEDLVIFEFALFAWLVRLGYVEGRRWARIPALAVLGAIPLTRPNALLVVPAALTWLVLRQRGGRAWRDLALGVVALSAVFSVMGFRNHAAGGKWVFFTPTEWHALEVPGYSYQLPEAESVLGPVAVRAGALPVVRLALHAIRQWPERALPEYARRVLFTAGFVYLGHPDFRYRPHWTLMWAVFVPALVYRLVRGPRPGPMVELLLLWIVLYLGPIWVMASIWNYGFRYVVPAVLPAVAGAVVLAMPPRGTTGPPSESPDPATSTGS